MKTIVFTLSLFFFTFMLKAQTEKNQTAPKLQNAQSNDTLMNVHISNSSSASVPTLNEVGSLCRRKSLPKSDKPELSTMSKTDTIYKTDSLNLKKLR